MMTLIAAVVAVAAAGQVPPVRQDTPSPMTELVSAPAGVSAAVALQPTTESAVLSSPVPTVAIVWGFRATIVGGQVVVSGGERATAPGAGGQIAVFRRVDGRWSCDPRLAQLDRLPVGSFFLNRLVRAGSRILTAVDRLDVGTTVRVLEPRDGSIAEVASLRLPAEHDLPTFATSYAGTEDAAFVGSADLRFDLGEASERRSRDPRVFVYSRSGNIWALQGFVRCPAPGPGAAADAMWFGVALAADPDVLAVGQPAALPPRPSETLPTSGKASVHVFRRSANQWLPEARLEGSAVTASPCFGNELAVSGDLLAVRSQDLSSPEGVGSVWLYARRDGKWSFVQELVPAAGISKGRAYGLSLAISGGRVLVGDCTSRGADEIVPVGPGAVLVFEERGGSWTNTLRLMPKEPCGARSFGTDLSAEWPLVAVGRPRKERLGLEPGGAYVFDLTGK